MVKKFSILLSSMLFVCMLGSTNAKVVKTEAWTAAWRVPATVKVVDDEVLNSIIDPRADGETEKSPDSGVYYQRETYHPDDRQWQGLVTVACTGKRLWATWYTGGTKEPDPFNYVVLAYSDDDGETWVDPYIVIDHPDPGTNGVCLVLPHLYVEGDELVLQYLQQFLYNVRFQNPDAENINDVIIGEPQLISNVKIHKAPTRLTDEDGSEIAVVAYETIVGATESVSVTYIDVWNETTKKYERRGMASSSNPSKRRWPESQVVELERGKWMVVSRIEGGTNGGVEVAYSNDYGRNWSAYEDNLGEPFIGPGSKGHIMKLASGNHLVVNHDTTSSRSSLCAYLSTDKGQTYPYKLSLDGRNDLSYPSAFEKDGYIYVVWDKGRYLEKELRISKITERDIIEAEVTAPGTFEKRVITKLNDDYADIVSIDHPFPKVFNVRPGTPSADIRGQLPTTFKVTDSQGEQHTVTGVWKSAGYKPDIVGKYFFTFNTDLSAYLQDTYNLLRVKVIVEEAPPTTTDFTWLIVVGALVAGLGVLGGGAFLIFKKKKV
ncbi:MAG: sialidase family protein [Bacilli bacterium]|jgi:hypothetical protein